MQRDADTAIEILETALAKESTFREADSLLVFEVRHPSPLLKSPN
jgi:hypothetical protein